MKKVSTHKIRKTIVQPARGEKKPTRRMKSKARQEHTPAALIEKKPRLGKRVLRGRIARARVLSKRATKKPSAEKIVVQQTAHPPSPPKRLRAAKPKPNVAPSVHRRASTADVLTFITQALDKSWSDYLACLGRFQQTPTRKSVHDLRVSIRRFTTALDLVDRFNPDNMIRRARIMLKEQLSELSTLRDIHVEMGKVRQFLKEVPEMKSFYEDLRSKENRSLKAAKKIPWKSERKFIETAVNRAKIKINARRATTTAESSRKIIETGFDVAFDGLSKKLEAVTLADYTTIHKIRLAFKPVRYMLEMMQPVLKLDRKQLRTATLLSRMMGQIQEY